MITLCACVKPLIKTLWVEGVMKEQRPLPHELDRRPREGDTS